MGVDSMKESKKFRSFILYQHETLNSNGFKTEEEIQRILNQVYGAVMVTDIDDQKAENILNVFRRLADDRRKATDFEDYAETQRNIDILIESSR